MDSKNLIFNELEKLYKSLPLINPLSKTLPDDSLLSICNVVEASLIHGLKNAFFLKSSRDESSSKSSILYPEPNFWPFVSKFTPRNIKAQISSLKFIKTEVGKARAWVRIVISEKTVEHYLNLILNDECRLNLFYEKDAFLRNQSGTRLLIKFLKLVTKLSPVIPTNAEVLNENAPKPLILAGLISDYKRKPTVLEREDSDPSEIAENCDDLLGDSPAHQYQTVEDDDGDNVSFYSHLSMLEAATSSTLVPKRNFSSTLMSTPEDQVFSSSPNFLCASLPREELSSEVIVHRRRLRRDSRSSDESKTSSRSQSVSNLRLFPNTRRRSINVNENINDERSSIELDSGIDQTIADGLSNELAQNKQSPSSLEFTKKVFEEVHKECDEFEQPQPFFKEELSKNFSGTSLHDELLSAMNISQPEDQQQKSNTIGLATDTPLSISKDQQDSFSSSSINEDSSWTNPTFNPYTLASVSCDDISQGTPVHELNRALELADLPLDHKDWNRDESLDDELVEVPEAIDPINSYKIRKKCLQLIRIQTEKGLDQQDFRCSTCKRSIGVSFGKFRFCHITGFYYCCDCLPSDSVSVIPAHIILNWDFSSKLVTVPSKELLKSIADDPFIRIDLLNPSLYEHCPPMKKILEMRTRLGFLTMYLLRCKQSVAEDMVRRIWPHDYIYRDVHLYSLSDLEGIRNGVFRQHLETLIKFAQSHIDSCSICHLKGFICELCKSDKYIYPYELETTYRCKDCYSVFHITCFSGTGDNNSCPKCLRRTSYSLKSTSSFLDTPPPAGMPDNSFSAPCSSSASNTNAT